MQKNTKKLIYDTFIDLLSNKPFDKITIRDIVETCGINRNNFYYYYSDIYDLLEEIFTKELNEILEAHKSGNSWAMAFIKVSNTVYEHKKMINNICSSRSYDYLENYMYKACKHIMIDVVKHSAEGMDVPEEDIEFIASFYEYAFVGVISEWFRTGMGEDPLHFANQIWLVLDNIRYALRRSQRRKKNRIENEDFI
ncbi:MAG: TetR/AcrR family transcriptional regulator [Clostridia bacterium]|nr:TetR/AcrR family transcriptional regulator [Clostridia bacterium]